MIRLSIKFIISSKDLLDLIAPNMQVTRYGRPGDGQEIGYPNKLSYTSENARKSKQIFNDYRENSKRLWFCLIVFPRLAYACYFRLLNVLPQMHCRSWYKWSDWRKRIDIISHNRIGFWQPPAANINSSMRMLLLLLLLFSTRLHCSNGFSINWLSIFCVSLMNSRRSIYLLSCYYIRKSFLLFFLFGQSIRLVVFVWMQFMSAYPLHSIDMHKRKNFRRLSAFCCWCRNRNNKAPKKPVIGKYSVHWPQYKRFDFYWNN